MKNSGNQVDVDLAEIRKMTVTNAIRQQEDRQAISQLRRDYERDVQNLHQNSSERMKEFDRILREEKKEHDEWWKKMRRIQEETWAQVKETDRQMKETDRQMKETDRQMKETDKKIKELSTRFSSTTGHIIEGLMSSSAIKIYEDAGFHIDSLCKNYKRKNKALNLEMEFDVVLFDESRIIVEEVKSSCDKKDVDRFLMKMSKFKLLFPEFKDKEVFGAVATINYEDDADRHATDQGLFVIRVSSDEIFAIDPFKMDELKRF